MHVIAAKGLSIPLEENPKRYISDSAILLVADSAYYMRRVTDGDLLPANAADWQAQEDAKAAEASAAETKPSKSAQK